MSHSIITEQDLYYFAEGTHSRLFDRLGARWHNDDGVAGAHFAVWAPSAARVSVVGDFNGWTSGAGAMSRSACGIWECFIPGVARGALYKYRIQGYEGGPHVDKADPLGFLHETPPRTASVLWDLGYEWNDADWMMQRRQTSWWNAPVSAYEVHLGSWRRVAAEGNRPLSYRELAPQLAEYAKSMGFTHVELLPVMEHPFGGSWGYQCTGFFAPSSRQGTPQDFMWFIDHLHQQGLGVILDWVPSHFAVDEHGLGNFDGTHLYEHPDPTFGFHPEWNSYRFNYGRNEVRSFLLSSALFWLETYHADAIRVDAVADMLHAGERENQDAVSFLRHLNESVYRDLPDVQTIAEESGAWPMVSKPTYVGGLGFGFKWDMGWMHDTLQYMSHPPALRKQHHRELTFRMVYAFDENFMLPLSHDEVVHGYGSLISKMPGDNWQKFANLRLLLAYMWTQPGKKLLFMGGEFAQWSEWNHDGELDWPLLGVENHAHVRLLVGALNHLYRSEAALHQRDTSQAGFEWVYADDAESSVIAFERRGVTQEDTILVLCNFGDAPRPNYRVGVRKKGFWKELLNSDAVEYGGSGQGNFGGVTSVPIPLHSRLHSITVTLPPLGAVLFKWQSDT